MSEGNIVGVDPHRRRFTVTILDERGAAVATGHYINDTAGYLDAIEWAKDHGPIERWGVENAASYGRHLAEFLIADGFDVRDVPPHRTAKRGRGRHEGKSDIIDSLRIAQETQANPQLARAFKRAQPFQLDPVREQMALWHNARKSLTRVRVQLLGEIDMLIHELPERLRAPITSCQTVRAKITAFKRGEWDLHAEDDALVLRVRLISSRIEMLEQVLGEDKTAAAELTKLVKAAGSTLTTHVGIAPRAAELQPFHVRVLPALRDVEQNLRRSRESLLSQR